MSGCSVSVIRRAAPAIVGKWHDYFLRPKFPHYSPVSRVLRGYMPILEQDTYVHDIEDCAPDEIAYTLQCMVEFAVSSLGPQRVQEIVTAAIEQDGKEAN